MVDKSLRFYGAVYHRLLDPPLADARAVAVNLVASGSSVLDIGCGTGALSFELREKRDCRVVGLDLSLRMLEFARKTNPFPDVTFVHGDATDLGPFPDRSFDYATLLMIVHELTGAQQVLALREALRVAARVIIIDSVSPLPKNVRGLGIRAVEATFGRDHHPNFRAFLAARGLTGILEASGVPVSVEHRSVFEHTCREAVVVSRGL